MILILCPKCGLFVGVRLRDEDGRAASCRSCGGSLDYGYLIRAGLPPALIIRLKGWSKRSSDLLSNLGAPLDDQQFVCAWKELRDETRTLLEAWRGFVETDADLAANLFDRMPAEAWTDEAIARWRREARRSRDLMWYGYLTGSRSGARSGVMPYPSDAGSDKDREAFRLGFNTAIELTTDRHNSDQFVRELAALESKYGRRCST